MKKQIKDWVLATYILLMGGGIVLAVCFWQQIQTGYVSSMTGFGLLSIAMGVAANMIRAALSSIDGRLTNLERNGGSNNLP